MAGPERPSPDGGEQPSASEAGTSRDPALVEPPSGSARDQAVPVTSARSNSDEGEATPIHRKDREHDELRTSKTSGLRWRRPASIGSLIGTVVTGLIAVFSNLTAVATRDVDWFVVSGLASLAFFGFVAYGLAANKSRERAERHPSSRGPR